METIVTGVIYTIIGVVGVALGYMVKGANTGINYVSENSFLNMVTKSAVVYAQKWVSKNGKEKFAWVVNFIKEKAKQKNITITDEQAKVLTESVYQEVKKSLENIKYDKTEPMIEDKGE